MANKFKKTKLAAALGLVGLGLSSAANAVVVVGGDNGWEVSFDGNVNAFYVNGNFDKGWNPLGLVAPLPGGGFAGNDRDASRVTSGFLPAFFSFNVKSPTVDGMYATARFSFAPTINNSATKNQLYAPGGLSAGATNNGIQGASIDTREVLVNVNGPFGVLSFGRTLSIYGRNAILKDMTLFGVGIANVNSGTVTAGRIGRGYTYPNFNARISYKTPVMAGFQAEVGLYDPSVEQLNNQGASLLDQVDTPRFEGELSFTQPFSGGSFQFWFDGLWQSIQSTAAATNDVSVGGWGIGTDVKFMGFDFTGYYYGGQGLGRSLQFVGGTACNAVVVGTRGVGSICDEAEDNGYYVQGTYTFNGVTKIGASYGESNEDHMSANVATGMVLPNQDVSLSMWTVGVYHDVNSWLKLIAEYSSARNAFDRPLGATTGSGTTGSDTFSIGSFFIW